MNHIKSIISLFFFFFILFSCVKDENVDFTQADNFKFNQQITASLITLNATLSDFDEIENLPFSGFNFDTPINAFSSATIQNELDKATLHFNFENTFDRDFEVIFNFRDSNNAIVFIATINVIKKTVTNQDIVIEGSNIDQIKRTTKVDVSISVLNSTPANTIDNTVGALLSFSLGTTLELSATPQINTTLISLNASLPDFALLGNVPFTHFDFNTKLDIFNLTEIQDNLEKADLHFELENTFNRDFEIIFEFLDRDNNVTYTIEIILDKISKTIYDESVESVPLESLKKSNKVNVTMNVINATTMDNTPGAFINFKSSITFFF